MTQPKFLFTLLVLVGAIFSISSCTQSSQYNSMSTEEFANELQKNSENAILIDVRTPQEYSTSRIQGAINIDVNSSDFVSQIETLDKTKTVYVYCLSGSRSKEASDILSKKGFSVNELNQGILGWKSSGLPIQNTDIVTGERRLSASESFYEQIKGDKLVMVDFYADWCRPCKMMEPDVNRIKSEREDDVIILKINTDNEPALSEKYKINAIPTLMMFKNNEPLYYQAGLHTYDQLSELIDKFK